jgi:hypothetical protein
MKYFASLAVIALLFNSAADAADGNVPKIIQDFRNLSVAPEGVAVSGLSIQESHVSITLASGSASVVTAADKPVGIFFTGKGSLEYRSTDRDEFPSMLYTLKKGSDLKFERGEKEFIVRHNFDEMLFLTAGTPPALEGSPAPVNDDAFAKHLETFRKEQGSPVAHLFALQRLNRPSAKLVRAEFAGNGENLVWMYDAAESMTERLYNLHRHEHPQLARRFLYPALFSEQTVGWSRREPRMPDFYLTDLDYALVAEKKEATLSVRETILAQAPLRALRLNMTTNTFGNSATDERFFNVKSVRDASGKELAFSHDTDELLVELPSLLAAGATTKLQFEIEGDFLVNPSGDSYWMLGTSPWFPQPELAGQYYTVHSLIKVRKPFTPYAPGETIRRGVEGDYNVVENRIDKPVQFAVVLGGRYSHVEETHNGVTLRVATYAGKNDIAMKKLLNLTAKIIVFYEPFLGPFPFKEFNIIEIKSWGFGQAPPGTMFITQEAFNPLGGEINKIFSQGINERFAHEIAHQYWGHVVKMPSDDEQWITESFAEYSASFVVKQLKGKDGYNGLLAGWKANARDAANDGTIPLANRLALPNNYDGFISRTGLLYHKGPYLLAQIHKEIGDDNFLTFLRSYQGIFAWKFGSTKHVVGLLQRVTNKDYAPFFEQYYWGTEMPK